MKTEQINDQDILEIATTCFKTIVAEVKENQRFTLKLHTEAGIQGFIVLLRPALPSIE